MLILFASRVILQGSSCWLSCTPIVTCPHPAGHCRSCSWASSGPPGKSLAVIGKCLFLVDLTWNFNLGKPPATCCHGDSFELLLSLWVMNSSRYFYLLLHFRQQQSIEKHVYCRTASPLPKLLSVFALLTSLRRGRGHKRSRMLSFIDEVCCLGLIFFLPSPASGSDVGFNSSLLREKS